MNANSTETLTNLLNLIHHHHLFQQESFTICQFTGKQRQQRLTSKKKNWSISYDESSPIQANRYSSKHPKEKFKEKSSIEPLLNSTQDPYKTEKTMKNNRSSKVYNPTKRNQKSTFWSKTNFLHQRLFPLLKDVCVTISYQILTR